MEFPVIENPFIDWSAHLFLVERTQFVLFCNTTSLYSTIFPAGQARDEIHFLISAMIHLQEVMGRDGLLDVYDNFIAPSTNRIRIGRAYSRKVTGSMTELILAATHSLVFNELSPSEVSVEMNDLLLSAIATPSEKYATPREVFRKLIERHKDQTENHDFNGP